MATFGALLLTAATLGAGEDVPADRADARIVVDEQGQLAGEWTMVGGEDRGRPAPEVPDLRVVIGGGRLKVMAEKKVAEDYEFRLNPRASPKQFDLFRKPGKPQVTGVYAIRDGKLYLFYRNDGIRPKELESPREGGVLVLRRVEK